MTRVSKKWLHVLLICTLIITGLLACNDKDQQTAEGKKEDTKKSAKVQANQTKLMKAHYLEEEVEALPEIKHATVVIQQKDAYVSVEFSKLNELNEELKNKVVSSIRAADPDINNIYISHNQDFNARLQQLSREIEKGTPSKELGESFERTIRKVFPELKK